MNLYDKIIDWLKVVCPAMDWAYFNVINMEIGTNTVSTVSGESKTEQYNDGTSKHVVPLGISLIRLYSAEQSNDNINTMTEIQSVVDAINESTSLPDLSEEGKALEFEVIQDIPSVNVDLDANACQYTIQAQITYLRK